MNKVLSVVAAGMSILAGVLHWDIWANHGYRSTPIREMFIASAVVGVLVGVVALVPRRAAIIPLIVANAAFLGAFALSRVSEVPTFHGAWSETGLAPKSAMILDVSTTLILVSAEGLALFCGLVALAVGRSSSRRSRALPSEFARA